MPPLFRPVLGGAWPSAFALLLAGGALGVAACGRGASNPPSDRQVTRGLDRSDRYLLESGPRAGNPPPDAPGRPAAMLDGQPISFEQLRPALVEAAGGAALEEAVLDVLLERECKRLGVGVSQEQAQSERRLLIDTLTGSAIAPDADSAERLLARVRAARGLGESRFAALLRRNAMMRALVAGDVHVTPDALEQARRLRYAERYRARLITVPTLAEATAAGGRLRAGEPFSTLAAQISTDASAERGGIIDAISPADPSYPAAIRSALKDLAATGPGSLSPPVALEQGFAILVLDEVIPATPPASDSAAVGQTLTRDVRLSQERLLMNQLARRLLTSAKITILDAGLDRSWRARTQGAAR